MRNAFSLTVSLSLLVNCVSAFGATANRDRSFDPNWRFLRADASGAESPAFDDSAWRTLDVPHDWSIEDLPAADASDQSATNRVGPFDISLSRRLSRGGANMGHFVGGTAWYRKHFTLTPDDAKKLVAVRFDGVYMNADFWINGHSLGNHPYGYTSFEFDLTPHLKPAGQTNVLAVRVRNEGSNTRWYSGSGIYRHTWLTVTDPIHVPTWGVFVTTPEISKDKAVVKITTEVRNDSKARADVVVRTRVLDATGKVLKTTDSKLRLPANETLPVEQTLTVRSPKLWSLEAPELYSAQVEIVAARKTVDAVTTRFGIRKIEVDAERGFRINGQMIKLMGGCIHHDNGPLGAAAINRAEERRIELLKANGFNAIRTSHNPPSPALLDACDRLGMLVVNEAFDCWERAKKQQDYHLYFKEWSDRDVASMVRRDRNHPSVVMWSLGNEIPEQFNTNAISIQKRLREAVLADDPTRLITQGVCNDGGQVTRNWNTLSDPAFTHLDVGGYNYLPNRYEGDHARHPKRIIMGTESYPKDLFDYWSLVEKHSYIIGDFVWTAMDYFGESGLGHTTFGSARTPYFLPWPWFNAWCGDLDICGFKKPQSFYRDVVWRRSQLEMMVHAPIPEGQRERVSAWGWPDEAQSWNWSGQEGKPLQVAVYSRCESVRLELNGQVIGEQPVSAATKLIAKFDVPYAPGELKAIGLIQGKAVAERILRTSGVPKQIRLIADRNNLRADRNDLSYVTVEIVDADGRRIPNADIPVRFSVAGAGELAAQGNGSPNTPASFRAPLRRTFEGRCLVILRPNGVPGSIELKAEAEGLTPATIVVRTHSKGFAP